MTFKSADYPHARERLMISCRRFAAAELGIGSSGNLSCRVPGGMLITPTGLSAAELDPDQLVLMSLDGIAAPAQLRPSSEWAMHAAVYARRDQVQAVVHCHSRHATILACAQRSIPPIHYMIAATGCREIKVAPYATFGTTALAAGAINAMGEGKACLLAHHGQLTIGHSIDEALDIAQQVEEIAALYLGCLSIGSNRVLSEQQMSEVETAFEHYGQQHTDAE